MHLLPVHLKPADNSVIVPHVHTSYIHSKVHNITLK
jgi:hypothetical protein